MMTRRRFVALALLVAALVVVHAAAGELGAVIEDFAVLTLGLAYRRFTIRALAANEATIEAADRMIAKLQRGVAGGLGS